jgi:hypothetical protein
VARPAPSGFSGRDPVLRETSPAYVAVRRMDAASATGAGEQTAVAGECLAVLAVG